ncbi:MAG: putative hydroxymethylpyrimidine transport system substrate-binding protein [Solirubrobacteraceae bacterium]|nr:putative hydroxymethylpyrimidine transport system substrate-binding protein [Solirubrobacteraceae bacterium]
MKKVLIPVTALVAALALAGLAAGCGEKKESTAAPRAETLNLVLDYFPNADHVGIYAALADGQFRSVGLDVKVRTPSDPSAPLKLLAAGQADLAISYEPEVLLARDRGLRVVSVAALVQKPLTSIVADGSARIRGVRDLRGKKIGTAGIPYQSAYLKTILSHANVNPNSVDEINVGFNLVPAMLARRVDATLGAFWNYEGVEMRQRRRHPTVIPVDRVGVPTYNELVIVARKQDLAERGGRVRRFLRALTAGYAAAKANPVRAVDQLVRANPGLQRPLQLASVRATLPVFFPADEKHPFGWQDARAWESYGRWMHDNQLVKSPPKAGRALTNEFLPGQGV